MSFDQAAAHYKKVIEHIRSAIWQDKDGAPRRDLMSTKDEYERALTEIRRFSAISRDEIPEDQKIDFDEMKEKIDSRILYVQGRLQFVEMKLEEDRLQTLEALKKNVSRN